MIEITKENIDEFKNYYHNLHDSNITSINYNINKSEIIITINVYWSGEPIIENDKYISTNKTEIKMLFEGIEKFKNCEINQWDYIYDCYLNYIKISNKEYLCFANDDNNPFIYIVCDKIYYEELKK